MDVYISNLKFNVTESDVRARLDYIGMVMGIEIHRNANHHAYAIVNLMPSESNTGQLDFAEKVSVQQVLK